MPKYVYFCKECELDFEAAHSLHKTCTICKNCGHEGSVERKPGEIFLTKKSPKINGKSPAGALVEDAIAEAKLELKEEHTRLENREYEK